MIEMEVLGSVLDQKEMRDLFVCYSSQSDRFVLFYSRLEKAPDCMLLVSFSLDLVFTAELTLSYNLRIVCNLSHGDTKTPLNSRGWVLLTRVGWLTRGHRLLLQLAQLLSC